MPLVLQLPSTTRSPCRDGAARRLLVRQRVACLVTSRADEHETEVVSKIYERHSQFIGLVVADGYEPQGNMQCLGRLGDGEDLRLRHRIDCVDGRDRSHPR